MIYLGLLYQDLIKQGALCLSDELPPVVPIVLYNGEVSWTAPTQIGDLIDVGPGQLSRYCPKMKFLLIEERAVEGVFIFTE